MGPLLRISFVVCCCLAVEAISRADDELQRFNGQWTVTSLVEDGRVVPPEAIPEWLPSGGQITVVDGAMMFTSSVDGKKHAKLISVDATRYPNVITLTNPDKTFVTGIYKFDGNKLVVCLSDPTDPQPPTDFSAEAGSRRMLMVLTPPQPVLPPPQKQVAVTPPAPAVAANVVTDPEISRMLIGTWKYDDQFGALIVQFRPDGTYSTTRSVEQSRLFKLVFIDTPLSTGTWKVSGGHLLFLVISSIHPDRVGREYAFTIRSISATDFIFVDFFGRVGQAKRLQ